MSFSPEEESQLLEAFCMFCGSEADKGQMDGRQFAKMTRDTGLINKKFTSIDTDIIFAKVKAKALRKIDFHQFLAAVDHIAATKKVPVSNVVSKIVSAGGPKIGGTRTTQVRLHDDKRGYTGVHAKGGPSTVDEKRHIDFGTPSPRASRHASAKQLAESRQVTQNEEGEYDLHMFFTDHALGAKEMEGRQFVKMAKDTKIVDKKPPGLTTTDLDIIFAKVKNKGARRINFEQFRAALELCADKKHVYVEDLEAHLVASGGPVFTGVRADNVKLHDDKSTYTGVYTHGGPDTGPVTAHHDISTLTDRTPADIRGVKR